MKLGSGGMRNFVSASRGRSGVWGAAGGIFCLLLAGWLLAGAPVAQAFTVAPRVSVSQGWSDNERFETTPRADAWASITPGLRFHWGRPSHSLDLDLFWEYRYYYRIHEYTGSEGGGGTLNYFYQPSPRWSFQVTDTFSSTYSPVQTSPTGELIRVRYDNGRQDRNTAAAQVTHKWGREDMVYARYSLTVSEYADPTVESVDVHQTGVGGQVRMGPNWRLKADGNIQRDDYEKSYDVDRVDGQMVLSRLIGPTMELSGMAGFEVVRADTDDEQIKRGRDYEVYSLTVGWSHQVSPGFGYGFQVGWSVVEGDSTANAPAGKGYPVGSFWLRWTGQKWNLYLYGQSELGEYSFLGENTGLTETRRVGVNYSYNLAQHWTLGLNGAFVHDDYQQDPLLIAGPSLGTVDSVVLGATLSWRFHRDLSLSLNYSYINYNSDLDDQDRDQNRILLTLTGEREFRY